MKKEYQILCERLRDFESSKRDSSIEKQQIAIMHGAVKELNKEYKGVFYIDASEHEKTSSGKIMSYTTRDGKTLIRGDKTHVKNKMYDTKYYDDVLRITNIKTGDNSAILFVMKGVQNRGGHQDNVLQEIGLYTNNFSKNKDKNVFMIILIDGEYIEEQVPKYIDQNENYAVATSNPDNDNYVKNVIEKYLKEKF